METKQIYSYFTFCALLTIGYGCSIGGTPNWDLLQIAEVLDTHEGVFEERPTTDIIRVINAVPSNNLNNGPYVDAVLIDSTFVIRTNDNFRRYEEYETAQNFTLTITFECAGSNPNLVFFIMVTDTNNNDPIFRPEDVFEFTVMPPLPPGYKITNFLPLTVRDIDLTTQRIDFEIFDSTNFAIAYDDASSTTAKEFRAALSTTTFIRNIPEPIEFTIRATDVDLTGDPRRSRIATVRIISDGSFELPEELVFTQTFYMADLNTENNEIALQEPISLRQGYHHEEVQFSLSTGEHSRYFEIVPNGNSVTLRVTEPIPTAVLSLRKLFLVVRADRQYTSGTSATVILQLPEGINLQFENPIYVGTIEDNALKLSDLGLSQGYENQIVSVEIKSDYATNFGYTIAGNRITLTMSPLDDNTIQQNTFLNLKVVASTPVSFASTVVTLEIIKDDSVTPLFERALYTGTYYINDGLSIEQITLIQGFDDTVEISLSGDHKELFQLVRNGSNSNLVASTLPPELFREQQILLTIGATKPRTVGATAAISIFLPPETLLEFERLNYMGEITDNVLSVVEDLVLTQGYENEVINVEIQHEHSSYFNYVINENRISLSMTPLDVSIIAGNSFLNLVVVASTSRSSASATVTLDIVKDDTTTPAFERAVYSGYYDPVNGLSIEQITILQGYDNTVEVTLEGEHREYFQLNPTGPNFQITTSSVPAELFPHGSLLLTIAASKPRTVGANAAISISLPAARKLSFSQEAYRGTIQDNNLILGPVTIGTGYADDIELTLSGDYKSNFQPTRDQNQISIQLTGQLPESAISENNVLLLTLLASAPHAISTTTTISLEIIKEDTSTPVFNEKIYNVVYSTLTSLEVPDIFLTQGYDENVFFRIAGEHAEHFAITPSGNNVGLSIRSGIPEELIFNEKVLVFNIIADKPLTVGARAAISVSFPSDLTEPTALAFSKNTYTGSLRNDDDLVIENIELNVGFTTDVQFSLNSEYEAYFQVNNSLNTVTISLTNTNTLPPDILNSKFIALELNARRERAVPVTSTVIIDIIQPEAPIPPVFSGAFYRAVYTEENVLQFEREIFLSQGFDNTVSLELEGDYSTWFKVTNHDYVVLITTNGIPESILETNNHLVFAVVAHKTGTITGRATIVVDLPTAETPGVVVLGFTQASFTGRILNNTLELPPVTLAGIYDMALALKAEGDYAPYFKFTRDSSIINIELSDDFPSEVSSNFIVIDLQISYPDAITGFTTLVIELVKEPEVQIVTPVFEQAYYVGQYSEEEALVFAHSIQLIQGFDETVSFSLEGEDRIYFSLTQITPNSYSLIATDLIQQIDNNRSHLLLSVVAIKPGTVNGEAAIVITLTDVSEGQVLGFERINYLGSLEGDTVNLAPIVLSEGFTSDVQFNLLGDLASFFTPQQNHNTVTLTLRDTIPEDLLPSNRLLILQLQATAPQALPAYTTLILEILADEVDPPATIDLVFAETYYIGSYTAADGLSPMPLISLDEGYDESVEFDLEGENAQWFRLDRVENGANLALREPIPPAVLANQHQLVFVVLANRPGSMTSRATIVIQLIDDVSEGQVLGFERINYLGSLEGDTVNLAPIVLSEGFTSDVQFNLLGDLASFFTPQQNLNTITLTLRDTIPEDLLPSNRLLILQLQATAPQALPAYTTLILEILADEVDPPATIDLVFAETYYIGSYTAADGLSPMPLISLAEGYDESVEFDLEGENAQWFRLDRVENGANLALREPIPPAVLANQHQLVFVVLANRPGSTTSRATIVIQLIDDVSEGQVLGFERINYLGSLEGDTVNLAPVVLSEGFTSDVQFNLLGDLASFFTPQQNLNTITLTLRDTIPEDLLPSNRLLILQLQATAPQALPAYTTLILEILADEVDPPATIDLVFAETYYIGSYTAADGLSPMPLISLAEGYDESVEFDLEGETAQWFRLDRVENGANLALREPIPPAVLANQHQLVFVVLANRPGSTTSRATIVIQLIDDVSEGQVLGFERINYLGSLEGDTVNLAPIVLSEGFTSDVQFNLLGDLASFFTPQQNLNTITLTLRDTIPEDLLPSNRLLILQLQATAPQALPAYTTLILEILADEVDPPATIDLVFAETYYIGSYTAADGLSLMPLISLAEGYDASVEFDLEGENAQWFRLDRVENGANLALREPIPPAVLANQHQLVFVVLANRPGSTTSRATIVIQLIDDVSEGQVLGFERINYLGSLEGDTVNLAPIVLSEGFTSDVQFNLLGDLASFFTPQQNLNTITLTLRDTIPEDLLPSNRLLILQLQATAPQALPAYTTLILEILADEVDPPATIDLVFAETYYIGSYTAADGLSPMPLISLAEGYDESVEFDLEGENAQWFRLDRVENGANLALREPIPPAVLANQHQLVFVVLANRPGSMTSRATIVIQLIDDVSEGQVLGFERINYLGSLEGDTVNLAPIVLSEGFTSDVQFNLLGDLASFFTPQQNLNTITLTLRDTISEDLLPSNRLLILQLQATAPQALPAYTTLILEILADEVDPPATIDLVFAETYYIGSYTAADGLSPMPLISLAEGYDESVEFDLEGENAQWFRLDRVENGANLALREPIPPAVLANQHQLVFVVLANRPGSMTSRATIVIQLIDDVSEGQVLGFERINYLGSLEGDTVNLAPIVLSEGFTSDVQFNLLGDLASFFTPQQNLNTITLTLRDTIPEDLLPSNRLLILQLQATAPQALPAYTTLILEILADEVDPPATIDLVFAETYYIGSYTAADGLSPMPLISLAEGYDESVEFDLEGENAQWFRLDRVENGANLALREPIPPAVLANQHQLVFVVLANRPGSTTSRATIVIQLNNSGQDISVTFDNVLYKGRVQSGVVQHETISLTGYEKDEVDILGTYGSFFTARHSNELVVVEPTSSLTLPDDIQHVVLELRADDAASVLVLDIVAGVEPPVIPTVSFSSTSYAVRIEMGQTGTVGQVEATADNSERVTYSLRLSNEHLQSRLSVSSEGELRLSAPADIGVYNFEVIATTVFTGATGSATINFAVEAIVICGDDIKTAPLIVVDRDEEEAHRNLVVIDPSEHDGCQYSLTNMWPADHNWLYVDETGLHAHVIDREDPAIAFMALSQIQVELTLLCNTETRTKRSTRMSHDWLGPYDYGSNTWLLGNSIEYNPRRTIVNLIVNDINDNTPKFDHEDLTVGYPVADLASTIAPRALIQLHATDADVGENAAIVYWSLEPQLAVSPLTGLVHIRNDSTLIDDMELSVSATDRNGQGLTGTIILTVKLLSTRNIAVLTVDNAFLEAEALILRNLSNALGYEVKSLRSDILPDSDTNQEASSTDSGSRKKREVTSTGASLVIHVYGLIESEPVAVERLSNDINENAGLAAYTISSIITLEEHLAGMCTISGGNIGLLVSTIVLSVLLFLFIVAAVVLFVYVRRKGSIYEKFSDTNSLASKIESPVIEPKPDGGNSLPRLNIEELKRSEKRLQDMLHAPIKEVIVEPSTSTNNSAIIPAADTKIPIIIQDKLKDIDDSDEDEFGERKKGRRKSVVTFNENVEKIIHVEDSPEESIPPEAEYEVYKL